SPLDRAQAAKNKGNKYFKAGRYEQAIQCYTEAISLCPPERNLDLSTFYQNRAAAYEQLNREPLMPSPQFIKSYFSSFTDDIISQPLLKGEKSDEDKDKEGEASEVKENVKNVQGTNEAKIEAKGKYMAEALLLRATFYLLIGNANAAKPDLDQVISMEDANVKLRANALIKRGSMYMQQQQPALSTQDFNMAADIDPQNADVYHHRGQVEVRKKQLIAVGDNAEQRKFSPLSIRTLTLNVLELMYT
ncbi:hypothetical protein CIB84_009730, partial [Bambusicola thoracicus]